MNRREFLMGGLCAATSGCRLFTGRTADFDENLTVFLSDIHVHPDGYQTARFESVVAEILKMDPLPRRVVSFGDLAYLYGKAEDYCASRPGLELLKAAGIELAFAHGNHDRRAIFAAAWPDYAAKSLLKDRLVTEVSLGTCDLLLLDTLNEPDPYERWITPGQLKGEQMDFLLAELTRRTRPFLLGAHHPLLPEDLPDADFNKLRDAIAKSPACLGWVCGHDHAWMVRPFGASDRKWSDNKFKRMLVLPSTGHWGDIGYTIVRATPQAVRMELEIRDHYFPRPDCRIPADDDYVAEKRGRFMTYRF